MSRETMTARRATELLATLESQVRRPRMIHHASPRKPSSYGICKLCGSASVTWVSMPSGRRAPVELHPAGPLVIIDGVALEFSEARDGERKRFMLHVGAACKEAQRRRA